MPYLYRQLNSKLYSKLLESIEGSSVGAGTKLCAAIPHGQRET